MSDCAAVDFTAEIGRVAASLGRIATADQVVILDETLKTFARRDPGASTVSVEIEAGTLTPLGGFLQAEVAKFATVPVPAPDQAASDWQVLRVGGSTGYRKADDPMARIVAGLQASEAAATARQVAEWPNPWVKGVENRTRQQIIINTDPARAARFKAEARAS
jgi:hypothetical protein